MKENLKIRTPFESDKIEAQQLLFSIGNLWQGKFDELKIGATFFDCLFADGMSLTHGISEGGYFNGHAYKEITLPELRELARPKEYLTHKFELVATNQPKDGWILVPNGANKLTRSGEDYDIFWKEQDRLYVFLNSGRWDLCETGFMDEHAESWGGNVKTLWQRENKVETVKGRFLHQEWYEAFGRGEALEYSYPLNGMWVELSDSKHTLSIFNGKEVTFRLKPQTIQIGSRTIVKPISEKPEMGNMYYIPLLSVAKKYEERQWHDNAWDNIMIDRNMIHLTADDALAHCDAILELMKRTIK